MCHHDQKVYPVILYVKEEVGTLEAGQTFSGTRKWFNTSVIQSARGSKVVSQSARARHNPVPRSIRQCAIRTPQKYHMPCLPSVLAFTVSQQSWVVAQRQNEHKQLQALEGEDDEGASLVEQRRPAPHEDQVAKHRQSDANPAKRALTCNGKEMDRSATISETASSPVLRSSSL